MKQKKSEKKKKATTATAYTHIQNIFLVVLDIRSMYTGDRRCGGEHESVKQSG